jgi:hypothetical protein
MCKHGKRSSAIVLAVAMSAAAWMNTAQGAIFSDTFSYADGELVAVSGGNWASTGTTDSDFVQSGKLFIDDLTAGKDYSRSLGGAITTGIVYAGFTLNVSNTDGPSSASTTDPYFVHFGQSASTNFVARVMLNDGTVATTFKIGITRGTGLGETTTYWASELNQGQDYRVVMGYDIDNNVASLWINPTVIGDTNITNSSGTTDPTGLSVFSTRVNGTADGEKYLDDLVVSGTFGEVVPEPTTLGLFGLALLALPRRRRAV